MPTTFVSNYCNGDCAAAINGPDIVCFICEGNAEEAALIAEESERTGDHPDTVRQRIESEESLFRALAIVAEENSFRAEGSLTL